MDLPASQQAPAPAGPLGGASSSSSWSGSWIDKWFFPEEGSSSDPNQEEPLATNQPTEVMGPEAPSPSWLKEKILRIFYIRKGRRTSSTVLKKLCPEDLKLERASPGKRLRILNILEDMVEHKD
ncbi:unnamed protein product [Vicia faba]|uniref:Uncharacterized protein n=1 Tax=Vicia faba TaxID=3906 RepID=R4IUA8_VICFA|nr:hypothetical protein [Vicia faba]AGC79034.1 hypothetical protein [Vicia faba]CAI8585611.1 unnamed protein product [Vicia faba]CAI8606353.1 unnamed protein product [Vicia faba]